MDRASRAVVVVVCLLGGLLATASPALAATITVEAGAVDGIAVDGACSLREAVEAANTNLPSGDCPAGSSGADTILLPADTIALVSPNLQIDITEELVFEGMGPAATVIDLSILDDDGFEVAPGIGVTFRQLAVDGDGEPDGLGNAHEAIDNRGDLTLESVLFSGNDNPNDGGAVNSIGSLTITDSTFEDNNGGALGGAVYQETGSLTITDSTFSGNSALSGGAVYALGADVEINGTSEFTANESTGTDFFDGGGALYLDGGSALIEAPTEFSTNISQGDGGGIYMVATDLTILGADFIENDALALGRSGGALFADCTCGGGSLIIEDSEFTDNEADGGGAASIAGDFTIAGATFSGNSSGFGGALLVGLSASVLGQSVRESVFENNSSVGGGGAIVAESTDLEVTDSTLEENHSTTAGLLPGGGAILALGSLVVLEGTTISNNDAVEVGGGISSLVSTVAIVNSTVSGNSVSDPDGDGGGIWLVDSEARLLHSTITDNSAPREGGGVWTDEPLDTLSDGTIIAGNPSGGDCNTQLDEDSTNLDTDGTCYGAGSIMADPMLGGLADNGGPTETHALLPGSPAVNAADGAPCSELSGVDQRGENRPSGGACDLGAYESQTAAPPPTPERTLTVTNTGGGTVTSDELEIDCGTKCTADHIQGTTGILIATPDDGFAFDGWEGDCASFDGNECTVELNGDREVTAKFVGVIKSGACQGMSFGSSEVRGATELIAGTPGDDVLSGNGRRNVICGLGGDDTIKGKNLGDDLLGGGGNDTLIGGKGADLLKGAKGTDSCLGGKGKDKLIACE